MNYYANLPTDENMDFFSKCSAQFEARIIFEYIKGINISNHLKRQILDGVLEYLKFNPR